MTQHQDKLCSNTRARNEHPRLAKQTNKQSEPCLAGRWSFFLILETMITVICLITWPLMAACNYNSNHQAAYLHQLLMSTITPSIKMHSVSAIVQSERAWPHTFTSASPVSTPRSDCFPVTLLPHLTPGYTSYKSTPYPMPLKKTTTKDAWLYVKLHCCWDSFLLF